MPRKSKRQSIAVLGDRASTPQPSSPQGEGGEASAPMISRSAEGRHSSGRSLERRAIGCRLARGGKRAGKNDGSGDGQSDEDASHESSYVSIAAAGSMSRQDVRTIRPRHPGPKTLRVARRQTPPSSGVALAPLSISGFGDIHRQDRPQTSVFPLGTERTGGSNWSSNWSSNWPSLDFGSR